MRGLTEKILTICIALCIGSGLTVPQAALAEARMTRFDPARHSFRFANTFENYLSDIVDWRQDGLCGGVVFAALDFYNAGVAVPEIDYEPAPGTILRTYLEARHRDANLALANITKGIERGFNPGGARNDEFFRWGLEYKSGSQLANLINSINSGKPVALGLLSCDEGCSGGHWVLAIGYDLGQYRTNLGPHQEDIKIYVYDPNFPRETKELRPDLNGKKWGYFSSGGRLEQNWRSYFVEDTYQRKTPPNIAADPQNQLRITFTTGIDNLNGTQGEVSLLFQTRNNGNVAFNNVNQSREWMGQSTTTVVVPWRDSIPFSDITSVTVSKRFSGQSYAYDNWDMNGIEIVGFSPSGQTRLINRSGAPLVRFTGDHRSETFALNARESGQLNLTLVTGRDDLRGGNDNLDMTIFMRGGGRISLPNVNKSTSWHRGHTQTISVDLPAGQSAADVLSVRLVTASAGGPSGDNWDLTQISGSGSDGFFVMDYVGAPLERFTGQRRSRTFTAFRFQQPQLAVRLMTGSDDLRGGNDNTNLTILSRTGQKLVLNNLNRDLAFESRSQKEFHFPLPPGWTLGSVASVIIAIPPNGGDDWDVAGVEILGRDGGAWRTLMTSNRAFRLNSRKTQTELLIPPS